jgi:LPXTG-motif cell wall-anchored protein
MNYKKVITLASAVMLTFQGPLQVLAVEPKSTTSETVSTESSSTTSTTEANTTGQTSESESQASPATDSPNPVSQSVPPIGPYAANDVVNIPDPVLQRRLESALTGGSMWAITEERMETLEALDINAVDGYRNLQDLTGLNYATNLWKLVISSQLKLQTVAPIKDLKKLTDLYVVGTGLNSLEDIGNLKQLTTLEISGNYVHDLTPLGNLTNLNDFTWDSQHWVDSSYTQIEDISIFARMPKLTSLWLSDHLINDLSPLSGNTSIGTLVLSSNRLSDLTPLTQMPNLWSLNINNNHLHSLDDIAEMNNNFKVIDASNNNIVDISHLGDLHERMPLVVSPTTGGTTSRFSLQNQTYTLPPITIGTGEEVVSLNPTKDLNGAVMPITKVSDNGTSSTDNTQVTWTNITESKDLTFKISYQVVNANGTPLTYSATITQPVILSSAVVNVHDSEIYVGDNWQAAGNFDSAVDKNGAPVNFNQVTVTGNVDTTKAGTYEVTYSYGGTSSKAKVTVKARQTAVNVHDSELYVGESWQAADNFDNAKDKAGASVNFDQVTVSGTVDTTKAGTYEVSYSYDGVTSKATITVKADQTVINAHDSELYVGDSWQAADNFDNAKDKAGASLNFNQITVSGTVDTTKAGVYEVSYSYGGTTKKAKVTVKAKQTAVNVHDSELYIGDSWQAADNFDNAKDKAGAAVNFDQVTVNGTVDTTKAGTYEVSYSYDGVTSKATITVKAEQTAVNVHDSELYVGDNWEPKDNFDNAKDKAGAAVNFDQVKVSGTVDTTKAGTYEVSYSYDGVTSKATITVKADQTVINAHDSELYVGDSWQAADNFDNAKDKAGASLNFNQITVSGTVDTTKAGVYEISYSYGGATKKAKVTVKAKQTAVNVHDSELYVGDNWEPKDNFDNAKDKAGASVNFDQVTVTGTVDTTKAGTYEVSYSYDGVTSKATITVKAEQTAVNVHDSELYVGDNWEPKDNFDNAKDKAGAAVNFDQVKVSGTVDTTKAGTYEVSYSYDGVTSKATITVKADQTVINAHDSELYVGDSWQAADNFDNAKDKAGASLNFNQITVSGTVDTTKAGVYEISYSYGGATKKAKVTVKAKQTAVNVHDSELYVGDNWEPKDNFDNAKDKAGASVNFDQVTVTGTVDTTKAGTYEVSYSYDGVTSKATITVKAEQTAVNVHDSELYVGDNWEPKDNFDNAKDKTGASVNLNQVTVTGDVDTTKAGTYEVSYSYDGVTSKAIITVKARQTAVNVHDSELYVGESWQAADNFDDAKDKAGASVNFDQVTVSGTVDTTKAGTYEVSYSYDGITSKATITVKADQTAVKVHDSELYVGDSWEPKDNFDQAVDRDGQPVDFSLIEVDTPSIDTTQVGTYKVIYTYQGVSSSAMITVKNKPVPQVTTKVTVRYVDEAGNELAPATVLTGEIGATYVTTAKDITGWKVKTAPENAQGTFSDQEQMVTYVYEKEPKQTQIPPSTSDDSQVTIAPTIKNKNQSSDGKSTNTDLPSTGAVTSYTGMALGVAIVVGATGLFKCKKRKN